MTEASIRTTVGRIRHRRGKEEARVWALTRGYDVRWTKDGIKITPMA